MTTYRDHDGQEWLSSGQAAVCDQADCGKPVKARDMCSAHYKRWQLYGDPDATPRFDRDPDARFWSRVDVGHPAGCWWWTGKVKPNGYGQFTLGRRVQNARREVHAHRYAYEQLVALIPDGLYIDHLCRNRVCVNPDHLDVVTPAENSRRGWSARKTRCKRGHPLSGTNLHVAVNGRRACKTCRAASKRGELNVATHRIARADIDAAVEAAQDQGGDA